MKLFYLCLIHFFFRWPHDTGSDECVLQWVKLHMHVFLSVQDRNPVSSTGSLSRVCRAQRWSPVWLETRDMERRGKLTVSAASSDFRRGVQNIWHDSSLTLEYDLEVLREKVRPPSLLLSFPAFGVNGNHSREHSVRPHTIKRQSSFNYTISDLDALPFLIPFSKILRCARFFLYFALN